VGPSGDSALVRHPVVFFLFNRPDLTRLVFEVIRRAAPSTLYLIADGPRHEADAPLCAEARAVVQSVDWTCTVHTLFREQNLGCGLSVASGIDYVFEREEAAIFLEDDTFPSDSFFTFCDELLDRYRSNPAIVHIGGVSFWASRISTKESYYFSNYNQCWGGWATWKRAWSHYDFQLSDFPNPEMDRTLRSISHNKSEYLYWRRAFELVQNGSIDTWDYQWTYACWKQQGLSIIPTVSLIKNLGFRSDASHSLTAHPLEMRVKNQEIRENIHPTKIERNKKLDRQTYNAFFKRSSWTIRESSRKILFQLYIIYKYTKNQVVKRLNLGD
jgi:hypothetical protein